METWPTPNLALKDEKPKSIELSMGNGVQDSYIHLRRNGFKKTIVSSWKASLKNGFVSAFRESFSIHSESLDSDFALKLNRAELEIIPAESGNGMSAMITFNAVLLDSNGKEISQMASTAYSKKSAVLFFYSANSSRAMEITNSAVESMYEMIAKEMFTE